MRLFLIATLCLAFTASTVRAHEPAECNCPCATTDPKQKQREEWVKYRLRERSEVRIGWPLFGVILGTGIMTLGVSMLVNSDGNDARYAGSGVSLALGTPIAVVSAVVLTKRVQKRRAILRDVMESAALGGLGFRF